MTVYYLAGIVGLVALSVWTRSFFFLTERDWPMPGWLVRGLRLAPVAALSAVIMPEVVLNQGVWTMDWRDARCWGFVASVGYAWWSESMLGTILFGMAVYLLCRHALGWG